MSFAAVRPASRATTQASSRSRGGSWASWLARRDTLELRLEPCRSGGELVRVLRLGDDLDLGSILETRVGADEHVRIPLTGFGEDADDLLLPRLVPTPP